MNQPSQTSRDFSLEWCGRVPISWTVRRIKDIAELRSGDAIDAEQIAPDGDYPVFGGNGIRGFTTSFTHDGHYVLIGRQGALCGNINYARGKFWATEHAVVATLLHNYDTIWFGELLRAMNLNQYSNAAAQPGLAVDRIKFLRLPVPTFPEQQRIAAYLDESCAAIDAAVATKRRQIETLDGVRKSTITRAMVRGLNPAVQLKTSGQHWLGNIPAHWTAPCLKRLLIEPLTYGLNEAAELEDRELPRYLRITDFDESGVLRDDTFRSLPREVAREAPLAPNDVLFARSGATVGKTFLFRAYQGDACFAGYLIRARTAPWKISPLFLYLFTKTTAYEAWKNLIFTQATIQNISAEKYNYLAIPLPPVSEQHSICGFVEQCNANFARLTASISRQIDTLLAYRKSLIHECVTGQRRITEHNTSNLVLP